MAAATLTNVERFATSNDNGSWYIGNTWGKMKILGIMKNGNPTHVYYEMSYLVDQKRLITDTKQSWMGQ